MAPPLQVLLPLMPNSLTSAQIRKSRWEARPPPCSEWACETLKLTCVDGKEPLFLCTCHVPGHLCSVGKSPLDLHNSPSSGIPQPQPQHTLTGTRHGVGKGALSGIRRQMLWFWHWLCLCQTSQVPYHLAYMALKYKCGPAGMAQWLRLDL